MFKFKLTESKQDIQKFVDKFGQDTYDEFKKSSQRLKNNNMSTDIYTYINDDTMDKKKLDTILFNLKQKVSAKDNDITKIQGKYEYIGQGNGYKVYKPLDAVASMNLGVGTGWCTTGRYGHYGEDNFKPSLDDAKRHFNDYIRNGLEFYYFLDEETMKGLYAVAYNPSRGSYEVFNAEDKLVSKVPNIPKLKGLPENLTSDFLITNGILKEYKGTGGDVVIPDSVISIGDRAFKACAGLTTVIIPDSVKSIGDNVFWYCTGLVSVTIPDSVTYIGYAVFSGCASLTSVLIGNGVTSISSNAFRNCSSLTSMTIPDSVTSISERAFYRCTGLMSMAIPESVSSIGESAFFGCDSLASVTIPESVTSISWTAFNSCKNLTLQVYAGSYAEKYAKEKGIPYKVMSSIKENFTFKLVERLAGNRKPIRKQLPTVSGADLLTIEEAEKLPKSLRKYIKWWWLRSPGCFSNGRFSKPGLISHDAAYVNSDGSVNGAGDKVSYVSVVRPALRITNLNDYKVDDDFKFNREWFRIVDENTALCLGDIGACRFDEESNDYEKSEIKQFVDDWFNSAQNKNESMNNKMDFRFKLVENISEDYDEEKVAIANRTSRTSGASALNKDGTIRSVVGRYVLDNIDKKASILDFGAGKDAVQTQALRNAGFEDVTAYDFGVSIKNGVHDPNALSKKYDVVFASNVLNVSSDEDMLRETLRDIDKAASKTIIFNYPSSPRKAGLSTKEIENIIVDEYGIKPTVVVGPKSSPVWRIDK